MADVESNIRIDFDTTAALSSLKRLQAELSRFNTQLASGSAASAASAKAMQQELVNSINATGKFSARFKQISTTTESFTNALEKNKLSMGEYFRFAGASSSKFSRFFKTEFNTINKVARERVKDLQTQYIQLGRDANGAMQSIAVRPKTLDMSNLGTQTAIAAQKQQILNKLLTQGSTNLLNFGKNTQWAGRQLMVGFTIPLTIFGAMASKTFMELEEQTIKFRKVYGDLFTPDAEREAALADIEKLGQAFTKYGVAVSETVGLAAEAAAAGFGGVDLQRQTEQALRISILGQLDQQKALETTISLQNAFKISSEDLAESIDFLNAVENQTVVALDDITTAIPKVAPVIRSLGGDVRDLAFFLAAMKEGGVNASEGANALKSSLGRLINPTKVARETLGQLGIDVVRIVEENTGDLKSTILELGDALDTLDPLNRSRAIEELFGKFQFARMSTLFDNINKDGNQASRVLDLAASSAQELANLSQKELGMASASAMNKFNGAVERLQRALAPIGELFLKLITPLVDFATSVLDRFNQLDQGVKNFIAGLLGVLGGIGPIAVMTFGLIANGAAQIIKAFIFLRNLFLRTGKSSNVLGEQLGYMTQEQIEAAAVASSLNKTHSTLVQTFTSEKSAVMALGDAYQKAAQQARAFNTMPVRAANPGGMRLASGIVSVPGRRGDGDVVPAMLSPGEAVIPTDMAKKYAPLINGMISDSIPGYEQGRGAPGAAFKSMFAIAQRGGINSSQGEVSSTGFTRMEPNLVNTSTAYIDQIMKKVGVSLESVNTEIKMWKQANKPLIEKSIKALQEGATEAQAFGPVIKKFNNDIKKANGPTSQFIQGARKHFPEMQKDLMEAQAYVEKMKLDLSTGAGTTALAKGLPNNQAAQMMSRAPQNRLFQRRNMARNALVAGLGGTSSMAFSGVPFVSDYKSMQGVGATAGHYNVAQEREIYLKNKRAADVETKTAQQNSKTAQKKRQNASQESKNVQTSKQASDLSINAAKARIRQDKEFYARMATQSFQRRTGIARGPVSIPSINLAGPGVAAANNQFDGFTSKMGKATFALSSLAGMGMFAGGAIGEVASQMFMLSNAMFLLTPVIGALAKRGMLSGVLNRVTSVKQGLGMTQIASGGKGLGGLFKTIGNGLKFALRFLGPVGIAFSALAVGVPFLVGIINDQKEKVESLGKAARFTADELQSLGDRFNVVVQSSTIADAFAVGSGEGATAEERDIAKELQADEDFLKDYESRINAVKRASQGQAESILDALSIQLSASGFGQDAVNGIVLAIAEAAGQTSLNLQFSEIDLTTPEGKAKLKEAAQKQVDELKGIIGGGLEQSYDSFSGAQFSQGGVSITRGRFQEIQKEIKNQALVTGAAFANLFDAVNIGFNNGTLSGEEFNTQLDGIVGQLESLSPAGLEAVMPALAENLGIEEELSQIKSYADQILVIKAATAGADISQYLGVLAAASQPGATAEDRRFAGMARSEINREIRDSIKATQEAKDAIEEETQAMMDQAALRQEIESAQQSTEKSIENLDNQIAAYNILIQQGYDAEEAFTLASNGAIALQIAMAAVGETDFTLDEAIAQAEEFITKTNQFNKLRPTSSSSSSSANKSPFTKSVEDLKEQRAEIANNLTAYAKLRKAGFSVSEAFKAAEDPIVAAGIASTKVGTSKWRQLTNLIEEVDQKLRQSELLKLLRGQRSDLELQMEFAAIVPELAEIGLELEDIQDILDDPNLAKSFIEDLKDGNLEAEELNTYLQQMKALKQIKINIELSTEEGIRNQFDELYNQANELFDIQRDIVRDSYEDQISDAEDAVESINDEIDSINTTIEDKQADIARMFDRPIANIQEQIEDMQRSIEMQFERPMQEMRESMSDLQRRVELEFDRPIERLREESGLLANDLQLIDKAAEDINDKYDAQQNALDKVSKLNQEIINQQKSQLDLADALSQGDIASAAQLAQQMRAESAQAYVDSTAEALDAARETQISALRSARGMTRDEIADRQFDIEQEIFKLEEDRKDLSEEIQDIEDEIYELQEQQEEKLIEIRDLEDEIYRIEQKREPALKEIEELQIQIGNIERGNLRTAEDRLKVIQDQEQAEIDAIDAKQEAWDDARLFAQQAAIDAGEYNDVLTMTKDLMDGTLDSWEAIKDKVVELKIKQVYLPPEGTPVSPGYEPGPGTDTGPSPAPAPTNSMTGDPIKDRDILKERARNVQQASSLMYNESGVGRKLEDYEKYYNAAMNASSIQAAMHFTPLLKAAYSDLDSTLTSLGFAQGGQVKGYGMGGMVAKYAMGGNVMKLAQGGMFKSLGSDIVPAMLTPGEFVIKRAAVNEIGVDKLEKLNSTGEMNDGSVYNYSVNVNVSSDANPDDIARTVISQIKRIDSQRIKGNRF